MSQLQIEVSLNAKGAFSLQELNALKATVSSLEEVFQFITNPEKASYQEEFSTLVHRNPGDEQNCLASASFVAPVDSEDDIPVPLDDSSLRFVVVDAVEGGGRIATVVQNRVQAEMEFIENHYPTCIVLKVTQVPSSEIYSKDSVLRYIEGAWGDFQATKFQNSSPAARRRAFWLQTLKTPSSWLSVSNFVLIAALASCTSVFLAWLRPEILAAAAPALVGTGMVALAVGAVAFLFFAPWKMYEHYNAWRFETYFENHLHVRDYNDYLRDNATGWSEYCQEIEEENNKQARQEFPHLRQKISYGHYLLSLGSQLWAWGKAHKAQAALVAVGLILSAALIGFGVGFFLGDPLSMTVLSPMLDLVNNVLSAGLTGLGQIPGLEILASLFTTYIGHIIGVVLTAALPLIIMDGMRRLADTIWKGQQAGGEPLLMVEDDFKKGYDATAPEFNEDLGARITAGAFWTEVGEEIKEQYVEWQKPKPTYQTL